MGLPENTLVAVVPFGELSYDEIECLLRWFGGLVIGTQNYGIAYQGEVELVPSHAEVGFKSV